VLAAGTASGAIQTFEVNADIALSEADDFLIDVNGDGIDDLNAQNFTIDIYNGTWQRLYTLDSGSAEFPDGLKITNESYTVPGLGDYSYATPQTAGDLIDGSGMFSYFTNLSYGGLGPAVSDLDAGPILLGFELGIAGQKHFGWVRVQVDLSSESGASTYRVIDGAYEDVAGVAIEAGAIPEPASLGLLAAGAAGLLAYRGRRDRVA
jgi:hypothetical protein